MEHPVDLDFHFYEKNTDHQEYFTFFFRTASVGSPKDLTTEEMRKLLERNEVVQGGGGSGLQPFDLGNV